MKNFGCPCVALLIILLSGCGSLSNLSSNMTKGAELGGAAGALAGGVIGSKSGSTFGGALIGGGLGVIAGAMIGGLVDRPHHASTVNGPAAMKVFYGSNSPNIPTLPYPEYSYSEKAAYQPVPHYRIIYLYQETGYGQQAIPYQVYDTQP